MNHLRSQPAPIREPQPGMRLYRVPDAMRILSMSRSVIYDKLRSGRLRSVHEGRARRIPASAIAEYIALLEREARSAAWYSRRQSAPSATRTMCCVPSAASSPRQRSLPRIGRRARCGTASFPALRLRCPDREHRPPGWPRGRSEVTETVYRKQIRPVLLEGAEAMDRIFAIPAPGPT